MNKVTMIMRLLISKFTPMIDNTVFFDSFQGQYNDNPKYISQKLHEISPGTKIVWSKSEKCHEIFPSYITEVRYGSPEYFKYALNSAVTVDNHTGIRTLGFRQKEYRIVNMFLKKRGQLSISTWHGTPLKKIGKDQLLRMVRTFYTNIDYCVSGCRVTSDLVGNAFFIRERMREYGTPRNDIFFADYDDTRIAAIKEKLHIPPNKSVVLFAPTFRKSIEHSGLQQIIDLQLSKLLNVLESRFHREFILVFRTHHSVQEKIERNWVGGIIVDGNIGDDMQEYLTVSDILITDYSSCMFDFALTSKPVFLYIPDRDKYCNDERGIYMNIDELPFPNSGTSEKLYAEILGFDDKLYSKKVEAFLKSIGNIEDGQASRRVAEDIVMHLSKRRKRMNE